MKEPDPVKGWWNIVAKEMSWDLGKFQFKSYFGHRQASLSLPPADLIHAVVKTRPSKIPTQP